MTPTLLPRRLLLPLLGGLLVILGVVSVLYLPAGAPRLSEHSEGLDDAYISYRYALNLVEGRGLVFNEGERVEGYSNLLWVLTAALLLQVFPPSLLHFGVSLLNVGLALASMLVLENELRRRYGEPRALAGAALWALYPFFWQWIGSGLEAIAVVLVQLLIWRTLSRAEIQSPWRSLALLLSVAVLLRADGFVLVFLVAGHFLLNQKKVEAAKTLLLGAPATLALFGFRLFYYQDIWPSTYYVKIAHGLPTRVSAGMKSLVDLLFEYLLAPFVLALVWLAWQKLVSWRKEGHLSVPPELSLSFGLLAYWVYVGGDHFDIRFLLVLFPLASAVIVGPLFEGLPRDRQVFAVLLVLSFYGGLVWSQDEFRPRKDRYDSWIELGIFLGEKYPNALLAAEAVGKTPYFSRLRTIDMLGLCDAHIAKLPPVRHASPGHEKSDLAYVLSRRPDVIVGHLMPDLTVRPDLSAEMYSAAGYRLTYLVNVSKTSRQEGNILSAPATRQEVRTAISRGYEYAVLVRDPEGRPQPLLR